MALRKLERRKYGGKSPVSIKCQNLHSFKEGLILLCQSILETRRIIHLHGSAHITIPLRVSYFCEILRYNTNSISFGRMNQNMCAQKYQVSLPLLKDELYKIALQKSYDENLIIFFVIECIPISSFLRKISLLDWLLGLRGQFY